MIWAIRPVKWLFRILKGEAKACRYADSIACGYDFAINGTIAEEFGIEIPADLQEYVFASGQ
jgi:ABC-type uncharacterized transport system substrate-binding protein